MNKERKKKKKKQNSDEKFLQLFFNLGNQTELVYNFLSLFTTISRER